LIFVVPDILEGVFPRFPVLGKLSP
jgi:hypothetical protein